MSDAGLEEKAARAVSIIREAVASGRRVLALYEGGPRGAALMHILTAGGDMPRIPVAAVLFMPEAYQRGRFLDKLRRLKGFELSVEVPPGKTSGVPYTEEERAREAFAFLRSLGAEGFIAAGEGPTPVAASSGAPDGAGDMPEFRPISGFSDADVVAYIQAHGVPVCSLDEVPVAGLPADTGQEDEAIVAERLKALGYL